MEIHPVALLKPPLTWTQCDNAIHVSIDLVPCAEHYYHKARPQTFCGVQGKPYRLGRHSITASRSCLTASCSSRHPFAGPSSRVLRHHISNSIHSHPVSGLRSSVTARNAPRLDYPSKLQKKGQTATSRDYMLTTTCRLGRWLSTSL